MTFLFGYLFQFCFPTSIGFSKKCSGLPQKTPLDMPLVAAIYRETHPRHWFG